MTKRASKRVKESPNTKRMLQEQEIDDLFAILKLSTAADREKVLQIGQFGRESSFVQDRADETPRVLLGDSTATTRPSN